MPRPLQREVIDASLEGRDVFVQAATSFGKSLCFQLPAVIDHGSMLHEGIPHMDHKLTDSSHGCHLTTSVFDGRKHLVTP